MNTKKTTCSELNQPNHSRLNRGMIIMVASVFCFTANTLVLKYLGTERHVAPSVALFFRAITGAVIVLLFFRSRRPLEIVPIFRNRYLIARGITGIFGTAAFYITIPTLGAGKATILCNTYVLFAVIIAAFTIGETLRKRQFAWIALAFFGIILLSVRSNSVDASLVDIGIAMFGALCAASTVVLIRQLTSRFSNGTIFMTQCLWVGLSALPFALFQLGNIFARDVFFLVCAGTMAAVGQLLLNEGYRRLTVAAGSSIQMAWPLLTTLGSVLFFGELFTPLQMVGATLVLVGILNVKAK